MSATVERPVLDNPALREAFRKFRNVDNATNLGYLLADYACIIATIGTAIWFAEHRAAFGLAWAWNIPVFSFAIILIGGLQHRLSGLAHEASHYSFLKNKIANDLVADLFCMLPIFSTVHFYRLFHLAHHQYTNDKERDPDLVNLGAGKRVDDFPMSRLRTVLTVYFRAVLLPLSFARYQWEYVYINSLGKGGNIYMKRLPDGDASTRLPRIGTVLGITHLILFSVALWAITTSGHSSWIAAATAAALLVALVGCAIIPDRFLFQSPFRQPYTPRVGGMLRLAFYTIAFGFMAHGRVVTGGKSGLYILLLWYIPITTSFMFYMLLRDIYQHTNADDGRLTNSRVFFVDRFTRWAVFVHGQDMHVPHHLFPTIPHYHLPHLHTFLKESHAEYAENVVECRGTFANHVGAPTILDVLTETRPDLNPSTH